MCVSLACAWLSACTPTASQVPDGRHEVVFWHFWGGNERLVVDDVVRRFNASQNVHYVRAVAMPGNNLDLKLFLAISGKSPPDLVNQDDPILADWAQRGAILPLSDFVSADELVDLPTWLYPSAWQLTTWNGAAYGLCNGLDVRALIYNKTLLSEHGLHAPVSTDELDAIAYAIAPPENEQAQRMGFLPKPKNLWGWGVAFGGDFFDEQRRVLTLTDPGVVAALEWMASYGQQYGKAAVSFRTGDQSLPGQAFPLLAGRYAAVVDGQWRVNDIRKAQLAQRDRGEAVTEYGVCPLPFPDGGRHDAGWINGNFFLVPRGAKNAAGAWEFMKFWSGFGGYAESAARTASAGGWIPVSDEVVNHKLFQRYLSEQPLFAEFIRLAASPNQVPRPNIGGTQRLDREIRNLAESVMLDPTIEVRSALESLEELLNQQLEPSGGDR